MSLYATQINCAIKIIKTHHTNVNNHFKNEDNLLGSAYDADSEGIEGKYYVWDDSELRKILEKDYDLFLKYFDISENGNWEGKNILLFPRVFNKVAPDDTLRSSCPLIFNPSFF